MSSDGLRNGCKTMHAEGDADLLIVKTAVEAASQGATSLIGEDADLLVLLCFHADVDSLPLYFRSEENKHARKQDVHVHDLSVHLTRNLPITTFRAIPLYDCTVLVEEQRCGN